MTPEPATLPYGTLLWVLGVSQIIIAALIGAVWTNHNKRQDAQDTKIAAADILVHNQELISANLRGYMDRVMSEDERTQGQLTYLTKRFDEFTQSAPTSKDFDRLEILMTAALNRKDL